MTENDFASDEASFLKIMVSETGTKSLTFKDESFRTLFNIIFVSL